MLAMLEPLGVPLPEVAPHPRYDLPRRWADETVEWLAQHQLRPGEYIVLGLGARRAKKQPTAAQILRWSAHFKEKWGLSTVFMWTPGSSDNPLYPGDDETAQPVLDAASPLIVPFRGPLLPALGLIFHARTSIFPDSGLMHFAAASPGGVLGLFAETDVSPSPRQWGPRGARADYLEARKSVEELDDLSIYASLARLMG
jgi:ADP-heptose:LPS heptosyltransferase